MANQVPPSSQDIAWDEGFSLGYSDGYTNGEDGLRNAIKDAAKAMYALDKAAYDRVIWVLEKVQ